MNSIEGLPELPDDLAEAFDSMKLAITRHRLDGWREISMRDVHKMLNILRDVSLEPPTKRRGGL